MKYQFLDKIDSPKYLKQLNNEQLSVLCNELRNEIIETVSKNGGHLASNLGAVELTVALHKVFDSPLDTIIFDVGHQCYAHKLLTGRYNQFSSIRKKNGISGFIRPEESAHDSFVSGHSSTSISLAEGVSAAKDILQMSGTSIAVIGDGSLTGGLAYEALINSSKKNKNFIVILNDNKMSISKNRGALAKHLSKIRTRKKYFKFKTSIEKFLIKIPLVGKHLRSFVFNMKMLLKNAIYGSNIFESLGFYYMGPADGHNLSDIINLLEVAKHEKRPVLLHLKTVKGKGYPLAESNPHIYHGVSQFDVNVGVESTGSSNFSSVFGDELTELARKDEKIVAITAAMPAGTGLIKFSNEFKGRFFDVGIAEQHAVTFAAALAKMGLKPVFAVYSTFLQRAYDQIIHDAAIDNLPITFAIDRAGFVGDDGETHQGLFDVSFLSSIPNVKIYAPSNYNELRYMLRSRLLNPSGVAAIRYPRGSEGDAFLTENNNNEFVEFGSGNLAVVTYGTLFNTVMQASEQLKNQNKKFSVIKLNELSQLSNELVSLCSKYDKVLVFEEAIVDGSVGQRLGYKLLINGYKGRFEHIAVSGFVKQKSVIEQRKEFSLDAEAILNKINEVV